MHGFHARARLHRTGVRSDTVVHRRHALLLVPKRGTEHHQTVLHRSAVQVIQCHMVGLHR